VTTISRPSIEDLYRQLASGQVEARMKQRKLSLSQFLERENPTEKKDRVTGHDAFDRVMNFAGIVTTSDPELGWQADPVERFLTDEEGRESRENVKLFGEWFRLQWSKSQGLSTKRAAPIYLSSEYAIGTPQQPYADAPDLRAAQITPAIPLAEIVSRTAQIDGVDYRATYLTEPTAAEMQFYRVNEAAEIPRSKITSSARAIRLHKFGRAIEASYEVLRRMPIDILQVHIARIGIQSQKDQVATALSTLVNGDGNVGTSASTDTLTALDPTATPPNLTAKAFLAWWLKWVNPYMLTTIMARSDAALQLELLNVGNYNFPLSTYPNVAMQFRPINQDFSGVIRLGITNDAPSGKLVGFDARFGIERVIETGSIINEAERWIQRQVELMTMSMVEGYAVFDAKAARVLNLAA
jgi:hypothetical protein